MISTELKWMDQGRSPYEIANGTSTDSNDSASHAETQTQSLAELSLAEEEALMKTYVNVFY